MSGCDRFSLLADVHFLHMEHTHSSLPCIFTQLRYHLSFMVLDGGGITVVANKKWVS